AAAPITAVTSIMTSLVAVGSLHVSTHRRPSLDFAACCEGGFARELHSPLVVDADAFHPDHFADFRHVFRAIDAEIRQFGNVHQTILAREDLDEGTEFFDRNDTTVIGLADFNFLGHPANDFLRAGHALAAR